MVHTKSTSRPTEVVGGETEFYTIYTLVDVTDSGVYNPKNNPVGFKQGQNLNTFLQLISLRTQPILSSVRLETTDISNFLFGSSYTGEHTVWSIKFAADTEKAWFKNDNYVHFLTEDFKMTPIHKNLYETADIDNYIDTTSNTKLNTYFQFQQNI